MRQAIVKASEGHRSFGKLLRRVFRSDEHLIVERDGYPVAVILSYQEYEKLRREQAVAAFDRFSRAFGKELEERGISEEELMADLEEAKREVFDKQYGSRR